jgi:hypothetical protein
MNKHIRLLTVCEAGEDRSVATAFDLKHFRGYDNVLNCGISKVQPDTFLMLGKWADKIIVLADPTVLRRIPHVFRHKVQFVNIGFDVWQSPENPKLKKIVHKELDKLGY